jgi:hypothetical protein
MSYYIGKKIRITKTLWTDYGSGLSNFWDICATKDSIATVLSITEQGRALEVRIDSVGPFTEEEAEHLACKIGDVVDIGFSVVELIE